MLQQKFGYPCVEKLISFIFMHDVLGELCILMGTLLHFLLTTVREEILTSKNFDEFSLEQIQRNNSWRNCSEFLGAY